MDSDEIPEESWGTTRPCPHCTGTMLPIAYGLPDGELFEAAERGEVSLGGCVIPEGPIPQWHCTRCGRDVRVPEATSEA